jgi:hypothetical protein
MRALVSTIIIIVGLVAGAGSPAAQQKPALSFQATLDSIKIDAQPQQVFTRQFRLTLDENGRETRFRARVEDWWRSEDGAQSFYGEAGSLRHSCARWVSLNPAEATVKPGETLVIRLTISVPVEMASAGYWCALTVDEVPDPVTAVSGIGVQFLASVSTGIFVNVGTVQRAARILDVRIDADIASVRLQNDGNTPVGVDGRLEFFAPGAEAPTAVVPLPRGTVLTEPTVQGTLKASLPAATLLPSGRYRVRAILDYGAAHLIGAERDVEIRRAEPIAHAR